MIWYYSLTYLYIYIYIHIYTNRHCSTIFLCCCVPVSIYVHIAINTYTYTQTCDRTLNRKSGSERVKGCRKKGQNTAFKSTDSTCIAFLASVMLLSKHMRCGSKEIHSTIQNRFLCCLTKISTTFICQMMSILRCRQNKLPTVFLTVLLHTITTHTR